MIRKTKLEYPVTVTEAWQHLRLDPGEDQELITRLIHASTALAENYVEKSIARTENVLELKGFSGSEILVDEANFISIVSIQTSETTPVTDYSVEATENDFLITLSAPFPETNLTITFLTGFAQVDCPEDFKTAILVKMGELYDIDRSGYLAQNYKPTGTFESILNFHKPIRFK